MVYINRDTLWIKRGIVGLKAWCLFPKADKQNHRWEVNKGKEFLCQELSLH